MKKIMFMFLTIVLVSSCKKTEVIEPEIEPVVMGYKSMIELLNDKTYGIVSLKEATNETDKKIIRDRISNRIISYLYKTQKVDIRKDFINNPDGVLTLGYFVAHIEKQKELISKRAQSGMEGEVLSITNPETDKQFECFLTAVSSFIGLSEARSIWKAIVTGSLETSTIIGGLALMAKRVATIATVTIMIYEAGDCLGWWN